MREHVNPAHQGLPDGSVDQHYPSALVLRARSDRCVTCRTISASQSLSPHPNGPLPVVLAAAASPELVSFECQQVVPALTDFSLEVQVRLAAAASPELVSVEC